MNPKRLGSTDALMHSFAHQNHESAVAGNVFYENGIAYSYGRHFALGRHLGDGIVLLNTNGYSSSTTRHKSKLRQAVSHMTRWYCIDPENPLGWQAIEKVQVEIQLLLRSAAKRRSADLRDGDVRAAQTHIDQIEQLRKWERRATGKSLTKEWYGWYGWSALSKRLKDEWAALKRFVKTAVVDAKVALSKMTAAEAKAAKKRLEDKRRANEQAAAQTSLAYIEWMETGERIAGYHNIHQLLGYDGLRWFPGWKVKTTQGVEVSDTDCVKAWPVIKAAYARFDHTKAEVKFPERIRAENRLGSFAPDKINSLGQLVVGCHAFRRDAVEKLAKDLGLI